MNESAHVFNHPRTTTSSSLAENVLAGVEQTTAVAGRTRKRQPSQQARQLLSCTKCRERKVKCDRIKPCSACCARGASKKCHFVAEGGDYTPIQQSYELRKLRAENLHLKERLRASKISVEDEESEAASPDSLSGERAGTGGSSSASHKRRAAKQRRFQGSEWSDSVYFGSPGLANVITDFATINLAPTSTQSLAHLMPRGPEMYTTTTPPPHPFATMFPHTPDECIPELLSCLRLPEAKEELLQHLNSFESRVQICAFPYVPLEITKSEVERFLADPIKNAQMCPDMLALLFAALALGSQYSAWDKCGGQWKADAMEKELRKGDVYIAAAMQALRLASFMHKPTLLGIQALIMMGPFLTNSGRFLDAWTLFGTTIRLAHSIGLHRHPKYLDPTPPSQRECFIRQTLWWWMLHMDTEYSMTLGRPLGISGIGDCPPPHESTTDPRMLRFGEFVHHFTVLARQILSCGKLTNGKIDEFTDMLKGLLETVPHVLLFDRSWLHEGKEVPEWPLGAMAAVFYCKTHTYLILLNRQRLEKHHSQNTYSANPTPSPTSPVPTPLRGRVLVLSSSFDLLNAFLFFHARVPAVLICWTMGQQAFNSCMILLLDAMETGDLSRIENVEMTYVVFLQLQKDGVHALAGMAVDRISWGLASLGKLKAKRLEQNVSVQNIAAGGGTRDVKMQGTGAAGSEAGFAQRRCTARGGMLQDTVMGNTGMLLLEDPGLQGFVPEAFQPLAWDVDTSEVWDTDRAGNLMRTGLVKHEEKETEHEELGRDARARSSEYMQDGPGSVGSVGSAGPAARYATQTQTFDEQPQGLVTGPTTMTHHIEISGGTQSSDLHQIPPPRLRHHSYPSLRPQVPASTVPLGLSSHHRHPLRTDDLNTTGSRTPTPGGRVRDQSRQAMTIPARQGPSQPRMHLSTLPEFPAATNMMATLSAPQLSKYAGVGPHALPSWSARPAAPVSSLSERALAFSQQNASWQYSLPVHIGSTAGNDIIPAPAQVGIDTSADEEVQMEGWRQYVSSGAR